MIVREHINEAFTDESDPIEDMGIGMNHPRKFNTLQDYVDFIIRHFEYITGKKLDPKELFNTGKGIVYSPIFHTIITKARERSWLYNNSYCPGGWPELFKETVLKRMKK